MSINLNYVFVIILVIKIFVAIVSKIFNNLKKVIELYKSMKLIHDTIINTFHIISILVLTSFKAILTINFIDYKSINYFNVIKIKFIGNSQSTVEIKSHHISIPIFILGTKNFYDCEISIINVFTNESRKFKFLIYKSFKNKINIYINNNSNKYFSSEIIFYGEINKVKLKDYECDKFNLNKRLRCTIVNIQETKLLKLIKEIVSIK